MRHSFFAFLLTGQLLLAAAVSPDPIVKMDPLVTDASRTDFAVELSLAGPATDMRSLTAINQAQLEAFAINSVEDLTWLVPGATSAQIYGIAGVPTLRGDLGEIYQNGQQRGFNRNMYSPSFNSIEAVEAVTGAPPASYGYASGTGGLVNFITKRPEMNQSATTVAVSRGTWDEWRWQVDSMMPLGAHWAGRASLERVDAGSFYRLVKNDSWDAYLALAWEPRAGVRWDLSAEYFDATFNENPGTNRPTQALIDRGDYTAGTSVAAQGGSGGSYFGNTFTSTIVRIDGSQVLVAPGDGATARIYTVQLTGTLMAHDDIRIVSHTYFENGRAEKHSAYAFYSGVPRSRTLEQRWEASGRLDRAGVQHDWLGGVSLRGEERLSYVDFFNEAMNAFDLTLDAATLRLPANQFFAVKPVPGRPGFFAIPGGRYPRAGGGLTTGISQTLHSRLLAGSVFLQDQMRWNSGLSLLIASRIDAVRVKTEDPLPPPGYTPVSDELKKVLPLSLTASLGWQANSELATYLTFNRAAAVESSSSSGGFGLSNNQLPEAVFANRSDLVEVGAKYTSSDHRSQAGVAVYRQRRVRTNPRFALPDEILVRGLELSARHDPTDWLKLSGNFAIMAANYIDGPLPGSIATVPSFDPSVPSDTFGAYAAGDYRVPGLPRWTGNLLVELALPQGWSLRGWGGVQGEQNLDLFGHVIIPRQYTLNLGATFRRDRWEVSVDCLNCTDEFNWRATGSPFAGGDLVTRELPRHWEVKTRYRF